MNKVHGLLAAVLWLLACSQEGDSNRGGLRGGPRSVVAHVAGAAGGAGMGGAAGVDDRFGNSNGGMRARPAIDAGASPERCASAELETTRVIPTVWLMVDASGSMGGFLTLGGATRWEALRDALLGPSGIVKRLEGSVRFGLYAYDGGLSLPGVKGPGCPRVIAVEPALGNFAAMDAAYPALQTGASTPTDWALLDLQARVATVGPSELGPTYIVLATDGQPNLCDFHDGIPPTPVTNAQAVATVAELAAAGTKVFAISMGGGEPGLEAHLAEVAAAGGTGQPAFSPASADDLVAALESIIGSTASCDVRIEGRIQPGSECNGTVELNGTRLICGDADGYSLKEDRQTLELEGAACAQLQAEPASTLRAVFPCNDVIVD